MPDRECIVFCNKLISCFLSCRWQSLRDNEEFEYGAFIGLAVAYAIIALVALIQLMRISRRVPEYGWTTQKVFHLLNLIVCALRAVVMAFRYQLQV